MDARTRFRGLMNGAPIDRVPWLEEGLRDEVLTRWQGQGMPAGGPGSVFSYDRRERIDVDLQLRPKGARGLVGREELATWQRNLERPIEERLGAKWAERVAAWRQRTHLLELPIHSGLFLTMAVGDGASLEKFMYLLADEPETVRQAMALQSELGRRVIERVLADVELDLVSFSEPIGDNHGPLISPAMYRAFVLDTYRGILDHARRAGVPAIVFMTYANAHCLLPQVIAAGFNTLWAMETETTAMDYRELRREFGPGLRLIGGIDLDALLAGDAAIETEMRAKVPALLAMGGCIPLADGRVRSSVSWQAYSHYRHLLEQATAASPTEITIIDVTLDSALGQQALALRHEVFVTEQGVAPELERDSHDATAVHLVALRDGAVVGVLRMVRQGTAMKVGRVAVRQDQRGRGIGAALMRQAIARAAAAGTDQVLIHAQLAVAGFYDRLGFVRHGAVFVEAGLDHVAMFYGSTAPSS